MHGRMPAMECHRSVCVWLVCCRMVWEIAGWSVWGRAVSRLKCDVPIVCYLGALRNRMLMSFGMSWFCFLYHKHAISFSFSSSSICLPFLLHLHFLIISSLFLPLSSVSICTFLSHHLSLFLSLFFYLSFVLSNHTIFFKIFLIIPSLSPPLSSFLHYPFPFSCHIISLASFLYSSPFHSFFLITLSFYLPLSSVPFSFLISVVSFFSFYLSFIFNFSLFLYFPFPFSCHIICFASFLYSSPFHSFFLITLSFYLPLSSVPFSFLISVVSFFSFYLSFIFNFSLFLYFPFLFSCHIISFSSFLYSSPFHSFFLITLSFYLPLSFVPFSFFISVVFLFKNLYLPFIFHFSLFFYFSFVCFSSCHVCFSSSFHLPPHPIWLFVTII